MCNIGYCQVVLVIVKYQKPISTLDLTQLSHPNACNMWYTSPLKSTCRILVIVK